MPSSNRTPLNLIGMLFPIIGTALLLGAVISVVFTHQFIASAARAEGTVVRLNASGAHPVIQFTSAAGSVVEFSGDGLIHYAVGDRVTVLYVEDDQQPSGFRANIDTPGALWATAFVLIWVGIGMIGSGLYIELCQQQWCEMIIDEYSNP